MVAVDPSQTPLAGLRPDATGVYEIEGRRLHAPVQVRSARMASGIFLIEADRAQAVIDGTGLRVSRKRGNRAVVTLALVKYVDTDLDAYDELGLCFGVDAPPGAEPLGRGVVANYIHKLPVSEPFTCAAGRGIWGFPKWVDDLTVRFGASRADARLAGQVAVTLREGPVPVPARPLTMACYSNDADGGLLRTDWSTSNRHTRLRLGGTSAYVNLLGDGPFSDDLRALGFPRRPFMTMFAGEMRATFDAPRPI